MSQDQSFKAKNTSKSSEKRILLSDDTESAFDVHGRMFIDKLKSGEWSSPYRAVTCDTEARPGYDSCKAHEYLDTPEVLKKKVSELALLIKRAKNCVIYSGAGISTSSGINDYASKSQKSLSGVKSNNKLTGGKLRSAFDAQPTYAHLTLTCLEKAGLVDYWVQQNHDGLPQKAGYPQHKLNEIHGAWFDPSNTVVPMNGQLRGDYFDDLTFWEEKADLVLALGTSMCGMNADSVVTTCAQKGCFGDTLGSVIINLQRTQYDHLSCLRIYAKIDDVMALLAKEFQLQDNIKAQKAKSPYKLPKSLINKRVFSLPKYDAKTGKKLPTKKTGEQKTSSNSACTLDLREGKIVRITEGHYKGDVGTVICVNHRGDFVIRFKHSKVRSKKGTGKKVLVQRQLGSWWIESAINGLVPKLPIINVDYK